VPNLYLDLELKLLMLLMKLLI